MRTRVLTLVLCSISAACAPSMRGGHGPTPLPALPALERAAPAVVGMSPALGATLDSIMAAGVAGGAAPGAELAVGRYGRIVYMKGFGQLDPQLEPAPPNDSTLWDMASLTKVVATTTAAMLLEEDGKLDIARPVHYYLPEFNAPDKAGITVRQLLEHSSGFISGANLWRTMRSRAAFLQAINARPLLYTPGDSSVYSDWNLILTGMIVERLTGQREDEFLQQRAWGPLGMKDTGFNPLATGPLPPDSDCTAALGMATPARLARIAPTEVDTVYRHRHIHGIVHDENSCALQGVAGHAGLFTSARDLSIFAQMMLNGGQYAGVRILKPTTIARWTSRQSRISSRGLGWDTPTPRSSAGRYFSPRSFGHTGFTGTSIWVDTEKGLFVILLTNRVNPTRANMKVEPLRRAVADAAQSAIMDAPLVEWNVRR
jgi:CubicO group peptidase (beta-lactamase class C family)